MHQSISSKNILLAFFCIPLVSSILAAEPAADISITASNLSHSNYIGKQKDGVIAGVSFARAYKAYPGGISISPYINSSYYRDNNLSAPKESFSAIHVAINHQPYVNTKVTKKVKDIIFDFPYKPKRVDIDITLTDQRHIKQGFILSSGVPLNRTYNATENLYHTFISRRGGMNLPDEIIGPLKDQAAMRTHGEFDTSIKNYCVSSKVSGPIETMSLTMKKHAYLSPDSDTELLYINYEQPVYTSFIFTRINTTKRLDLDEYDKEDSVRFTLTCTTTKNKSFSTTVTRKLLVIKQYE